MKLLEAVIVILIAVIILQDLLRLLGRTSLLYPCYVLVGLLLGTVIDTEAADFLRGVGSFGFIFLLFLIGLEIELPGWRETMRAFVLGILWVAAHAALIVPVGVYLNLSPEHTLICLAALTACSVGMAHSAWETYPHASTVSKQRMLIWMVALEVLAVLQFSAAEPLIEQGIGWAAALRLGLVVVAMVVVCWMAPRVARRLQVIIEITEGWRLHAIVLLVLVIAAVGSRMGLSAPKTAFFLGLFISRGTHESLALEKLLRPIGQNFLIPIFFIALGTQVPLLSLSPVVIVWSILTCVMMIGLRAMLYRWGFARFIGDPSRAYNLVGPNLTMVAFAVHLLHEANVTGPMVNWPILTGLLFTVVSIFQLPQPKMLTLYEESAKPEETKP